jgi:cell volume regulation protein A
MESSGSVELAKQVLSLAAIVLAVGTAFGVAAQKLRIPDVALFLLAGILVGPGVAGLVDVRVDSALNQLILIFGACYICSTAARACASTF